MTAVVTGRTSLPRHSRGAVATVLALVSGRPVYTRPAWPARKARVALRSLQAYWAVGTLLWHAAPRYARVTWWSGVATHSGNSWPSVSSRPTVFPWGPDYRDARLAGLAGWALRARLARWPPQAWQPGKTILSWLALYSNSSRSNCSRLAWRARLSYQSSVAHTTGGSFLTVTSRWSRVADHPLGTSRAGDG